MDRKIKIRWAASHYVLGRHDGIRVRIETSCAVNMAEKIFAYRMLSKNPQTGEEEGFFSHICSPVDLAEFPEDAPVPSHVPKWFRLNYVDVLVRSETEANAFVQDVLEDIRRLKLSLDAVDTVIPAGIEDIGGKIVCVSSSSSASLVESSSSSLPSASLGPLKSIKSTGTLSQSVGYGQPWARVGAGAGSPVGSSDSIGSLSRNLDRVELLCGLVSQLLLIQGYDFDALPPSAALQGVVARLLTRDATLLGSAPAAASGSLSSESSAEPPNGPRLFNFRLYNPDLGLVGDEKSGNSVIFGPDWQTFEFGADSDLWGAGLTVGMLRNRGDFGVGLIVGVDSEIAMATVDVDGVELEIFYR